MHLNLPADGWTRISSVLPPRVEDARKRAGGCCAGSGAHLLPNFRDDDDLPVICLTRQGVRTIFLVSAGYFAWGCFRYFCLGTPGWDPNPAPFRPVFSASRP